MPGLSFIYLTSLKALNNIYSLSVYYIYIYLSISICRKAWQLSSLFHISLNLPKFI